MILVTTSHPLSLENKNALAQKLVTKFGVTEFEYLVDPKLVIGIMIKVGDTEYYYNLQNEAQNILTQVLK